MGILAKLSLALLVGAAVTAPAGAQGTPIVRARLSTGVVRMNSEVSLNVEVEGVRQAAIAELPQVDGLRLGPVIGPSTTISTNYERGRRSTVVKLTWIVPIHPSRVGTFTIPPIPVASEGRTFSTPEVTLKVVEDLKGEELGFFRIDAPKEIVEGQPFDVELRFGYDTALGEIGEQINFFNLSLPWLDQLPGILEIDAPPPAAGAGIVGPVVLNSRGTTNAERIPPVTEGGRTFLSMRIRKRYLATRAGKLEFPTSHLEFGQVERGGFFQPSEKHTFFKRFPEFSIEVLELPEEGRPLDYTLAVGTLAARATVDRFDVDAGDSIKVSVEWTGEGNLEFFDPPDPSRIEDFRGFHLFGTADRKTPERRVVTYDLAPRSSEVTSIPRIPLSVYDPSKKAYVVVATDPIPIRVRALREGSGLPAEIARPEPGLDIRDIQTEPSAESDPPRPGGGAIGAVLVSIPVLWLGLRTAVRRRGDPDAPIARARRAARRALRRDLAAAGTASEQARALQRFLAARTGEPAQAWVGRDPVAWARAESEGGGPRLRPEDAQVLAALLSRLDERAWARGDEPIEAREIEQVADRVVRGGL